MPRAVVRALAPRPAPPAPLRTAQRIAMKLGRLDWERSWLQPLVATRTSVLWGDVGQTVGRSWVSVGRWATPGISPPSGDGRAGPGVEVDAPRCRRALERSRRKGAHALDPGNWYSPEDADGDPDACVDAVCSLTLSR